MSDGLKVKGTCKKCGRVVETTAPKGRATWRGKCPKRGCDARVVARRVRPETIGASETPQESQGAPKRRSSVVKVGSYATEPENAGERARNDGNDKQPEQNDGDETPVEPGPDSGKRTGKVRVRRGRRPEREPDREPEPERPPRAREPEYEDDHGPYPAVFPW